MTWQASISDFWRWARPWLPPGRIGAGIGEGMIFASAIQSVARQPEAQGRIQTLMFLTFALVETLFIFGFVIFLILLGKLPECGPGLPDAGEVTPKRP